MPREIAIGGTLVPALLLIFLGCAAAMWLIDLVTGRWGVYRHVWHPSLFRLALFACLFAAASLLLLR